MGRRNIYISSETVDMELDRADNASKYIERAILFYLEETKKDYIEREEFEEEFEILNQNFIQQKVILDEIAKKVFN